MQITKLFMTETQFSTYSILECHKEIYADFVSQRQDK